MTMAAVLIARIRSRERVIANIMRRNPDTYASNPHYIALRTAVRSYRDALNQLERASLPGMELTQSR